LITAYCYLKFVAKVVKEIEFAKGAIINDKIALAYPKNFT
jgi:hypothetical protein